MWRNRSRRARIAGWTAIAMACVLVAGAVGIFIAVRAQLSGISHIKRIDTRHRPRKYTDALNILLLGSDTRTGHNARIGGKIGCDCSDTIMLAHISPGRRGVTVLSIPRDTVVPLYACAPFRGLPGQQADPYAVERINATLAAGGPECVRETVEQQTGIFIDNVIELNFTGFEHVIDDVGGVNVCVPFAIDNVVTATEGSGLHLPAGEHHINGKVALQFWRTRYNVANGSDIARIARDQYLMAQIVKGVLHSHLLGSPTKLYKVIGDIADSLTTDASDTDLLHLALSLHGIGLKDVQFITAPWTSYAPDPNEVQLAQPQADALFFALAHDTTLPPARVLHVHHKGKQHRSPRPISASPVTASVRPGASPSPSPSPGAGQPATPSPTQVSVEVLDGSAGATKTSKVAADLTKRGYTVLGTGFAPSASYKHVVIEYGSAADLPAASTLEQEFVKVRLELTPGLTAGTVDVILGSGFHALAPPIPTSSSSIGALSTNYGGITARAKCRNSAFYGTFDTPPPTGKAAACAC
jgi:LCP family protein required for cell wall assembly